MDRGLRTVVNAKLTRIGPLHALQLCIFGAFSPNRLIAAERADEEARKHSPQPKLPEEHRAVKVRRAVWESLVWVLSSIAAGYFGGLLLGTFSGQATSALIQALQVLGVTVLLWATLFVRGWDIQSWGGVTLTERVNQWIYRLLYCFGTSAIVASLALM